MAAPNVDAWMHLVGWKGNAFELALFVERYPQIIEDLEKLRKLANVLVLRSRCPVAKELNTQEKNVEKDEEVPSQTYWTTIKNWRPW